MIEERTIEREREGEISGKIKKERERERKTEGEQESQRVKEKNERGDGEDGVQERDVAAEQKKERNRES